MTFSSYFNVLWQEPRLHISDAFLRELNVSQGGVTNSETMIPGMFVYLIPLYIVGLHYNHII